MSEGYSLGYVARRTGLSPQLIRTWEKRYEAVSPERDDGNRRTFTQEQVQRLELLRDLTREGHSIGTLGSRSTDELTSLMEHARGTASSGSDPESVDPEARRERVGELLEATRNFDAEHFERVANAAMLERGHRGFLEFVAAPFIHALGELWRRGHLKIGHEHFATAQIKMILTRMTQASGVRPGQPRILVTTPVEQWHELGALLVAAAAASHGWNVTYLGASLAAEEIASAAIAKAVRVVALSIVYPEDAPHLEDELRRLRSLLPKEIAVAAGGRAAKAYGVVLADIGARSVSSLQDLYEVLDQLRRPLPLP